MMLSLMKKVINLGNNNGMTSIISIGDFFIKDINAKALRRFASKNNVERWSRLPKAGVCEAIVKAIKTIDLEKMMYAENLVENKLEEKQEKPST